MRLPDGMNLCTDFSHQVCIPFSCFCSNIFPQSNDMTLPDGMNLCTDFSHQVCIPFSCFSSNIFSQ